MKNLIDYFTTLDPSKDGASVKYEQYLQIYDDKFSNVRDKPLTILEIGIEKGGSLHLWDKYFTHKDTKIIGVDIVPGCKIHEGGRIQVEIGDQADGKFLEKLVNLGPYDIIIDDGGHHTNQHITSFFKLFPAVKDSGMYFVEDLHTCYMKEFNGGIDKPTFVDFTKMLLDYVTLEKDPTYIPELVGKIGSISIFNSLILITKNYQPRVKIASPGFDSVPYPK